MNILVLGASGMLGSAMFNTLNADSRLQVYGTIRNVVKPSYFAETVSTRLINGIDVLDHDSLVSAFNSSRPKVVINCVGLIKQLSVVNDPLAALPLNAMLPHRLAKLCALTDSRLIHISTDCVFAGRDGMYKETDVSDAEDLYGKSKYIGEIHHLSHVVTLRTSIIGHGLSGNSSLIDWFLSQTEAVKGYEKAIFSGLPTVELAKIIRDYVIPAPALHGLYHVSAEPIDKCRLLRLVADVYHKNIDILPDSSFSIDRSLDSSKFRQKTGYIPPEWPELIRSMYGACKQNDLH